MRPCGMDSGTQQRCFLLDFGSVLQNCNKRRAAQGLVLVHFADESEGPQMSPPSEPAAVCPHWLGQIAAVVLVSPGLIEPPQVLLPLGFLQAVEVLVHSGFL